ncbi:MAG: hypothetical protein Q9179_001644 [Wetmoreana sp. 5 TL-2023]
MNELGSDDGLLVNRAYSGQRKNVSNCGTDGRQKKANTSKSRWPHALNVVTNFSNPPQLAQRAADTSRRPEQDAVDTFHKGHKRSNSSANIKIPDAYKGRSSQSRRLQQDKKPTDHDAGIDLGSRRFESTRKAPSPPRDHKGPIHDLMRASSKMTILSPSDRPIVIGISVPSDRLDQHTISPNVGPTPVSISNRQYTRDRRPSEAPTIVVMPAKIDAPWSADLHDQREPTRRRPPSSLYSRATNAWRTPKQAVIPPMPPARRKSLPLLDNLDHEHTPSTRLLSTCTVFDEDKDETTSNRPCSGESQLRILRRSSTDSIATRHRSQGWWNHIVSPFFPKPGAAPWISGSRDTEPVPDLPELAPITPLTNSRQPSHKQTRSRRSSSGHTSIRTDSSPIEVERRSADITMLHSPFHERSRGPENPESDLSGWLEGLGTAAEYYHACRHDQISATPYFECQNHVCIPRRIGNFLPPQDPQEQPGDFPGIIGNIRSIQAPKLPKHTGGDDFQQTPANRFSAAFKEAVSPKSTAKERPLSETTVIEDVDATPVVQEAQAAPVVRAPAPVPAARPPSSEPIAETGPSRTFPKRSLLARNGSKQTPPAASSMSPAHPTSSKERSQVTEPAQTDPPEPEPPKVEKPAKRFVAVMPPDHPSVTRLPPRPTEASPSIQQAEPNGAHTNAVTSEQPPRNMDPPLNSRPNPVPATVINHYHYHPCQAARSDQISIADMEPPPRPTWISKELTEFQEKEKVQSANPGQRNRGCPPRLMVSLSRGKLKTKKQKWLLFGITSALVLMIILVLLLAMLLSRKGDHMEVQSQWLNLTGFPPMPTGVSTIIQPDPVQEISGCIHPATLWSCAVPKEQQASIAPNAPDQPNFRVEIRFQNSSIAQGSGSNESGLQSRSESHVGNAVAAGTIIRDRILRARDFTSKLFSPSPSPPSREDQIFLGNTTDKNQQPFDGVATPFFISFINPEKLPSLRMNRRASASEATNATVNSTDPFPNLASVIPPPSKEADGTASPALLTPYVSAQPLRLYDRNMETEHYGFYTYFDRSIFLKSTALLNFTNASPSEIPDDENGGADEKAARVRCTWAQTRFLVQIWTRKGDNSAPLLRSSNSSTDSSPHSRPQNLTMSSANNFTRPGSFPYPISITLDRHGGDIKEKMVYCYGIDQQEHVISDEKQIQLEDRAFGGALVNPAQGPFGEVKVSGDDGGPGGIDGGNGGCGCRWENFGRGK